MFKWKAAEKLAQPKITEVIAGDELLTTAIVEEAEPTLLPIVESLADTVMLPVADEDANSSSEAQMPVPLPPKEPATDLGVTAAAQRSEFPETPPELGDRYEVIEFIGSGGMGSVWKVYDKQLEGTFAVKVLKPELLADATAVKRFEKEANLASDLTHANIAAIFGPGTDSQGRPFIIMGYVDGESLADILAREGKLSEERALDIFTQICEALSHSHMKGIIHRDIKPSNIIISKTESGGDMVHIVDFGIARCIYDEVTKTQALTKAVDIFGSPRYMSPEQFLGSNVTGQSDIYSLGCVLYEMLTGAPPFTDENPVKLILQHISETPDLSKIPDRLKALVQLCLLKEPEARAQNVDCLLRRLSQLAHAQFSNAETTDFLHYSLAAALMFLPSYSNILSYGSRAPGSINFLGSQTLLNLAFMGLVWACVAGINRDNFGRSLNYRILEFNLFLAVIATAIFSVFSLSNNSLVVVLSLCLLIYLNLKLVLQPKALMIYERFTFAAFSQLSVLQSKTNLKHVKLFSKFCLILVNFLCFLGSSFLALTSIIPVLSLACLGDLITPSLSRSLTDLCALLVLGNLILASFSMLTHEVLTAPEVRKSFKSFFEVSSCCSFDCSFELPYLHCDRGAEWSKSVAKAGLCLK